MYELSHIPSNTQQGNLGNRGRGVVAAMSGHVPIRIFPGALKALQEVHDGKHGSMRLAVASSADTTLAVQIGKAAMKLLEVLEGVTMYDVLMRGWSSEKHLQIGRTAPLSADKSATHFPILQKNTGIPYSEMLFFDDSVWSDHCAMVERACPGVVTQRTPRGMTEQEWENGLRKFAQAKLGEEGKKG